jgi:DNA-binding winged helix-turn-helix (wHTH) protein
MHPPGNDEEMRLVPFLVGDWVVEPSLNRLSRDSQETHVAPKAMDLLVYLAAHAGDVLSRETIIDAVWSETFVGENVLRRQIAALRSALGDDAANPTYIENIRKRGYRLIARVEYLEHHGRPRPDHIPAAVAVTNRHIGGSLLPKGRFVCALRWGADDVPLREGENVVGRIPESDVQIASERVSRRHAHIIVESGRATIEDLGSKNGTFVDGHRIEGPTELVDGDQITIGPAVLQYCGLFTAETTADDDSETCVTED